MKDIEAGDLVCIKGTSDIHMVVSNVWGNEPAKEARVYWQEGGENHNEIQSRDVPLVILELCDCDGCLARREDEDDV